MYVQAGKQFPKTELKALSMWVKNPGSDRFSMRLIDGTGQCHQIVLLTKTTDEWQKIVFPVEEFFAKLGKSDAVPGVAKYESWGGAKDGKWHQPGTAIYLLLGKTADTSVRNLWLNGVTLMPKPPETFVKASIPLGEGLEGWRFTEGREFPGAKGSLEEVDGGLRLSGDFTGGGAYVAAVRDLSAADAKEISAFRLRYRTADAGFIRVQLVDGTGQTHQARVKTTPDDKWNDLEILPEKIAGGEHWGGAKDGKWHGPPKLISIALNDKSDPARKTPSILLSGMTAEGMRPAAVGGVAFRADFEEAPDWKTEGGAAVTDKETRGAGSLLLSRTENEASQAVTATSPEFKAGPGNWRISLATRSALVSPDSSYSGTVVLEALDGGGKVLESFTVADVYGPRPWTEASQVVALPARTVSARFNARLNKTWGGFAIDDVSAAFLAPVVAGNNPVTRILFSTQALGNLLFPDTPRIVGVTVEASRSLPADQQEVSCVVKDYWGAEQAVPALLKLGAPEKRDGKVIYEASLDLSKVPLETGRYYEVHASSGKDGVEPFGNHTSFAILPEAVTRKYKPEEVPFTSRNWDNRIPEFIRLTDRIGVRWCGVWGGWSSKPPYKPEAPRLELVKELGMGWITGTPAKFIEDGKYEYDEAALREGVRNFIREFGGYRPMMFNLGNEPHGKGEKVRKNVEAYRVLYDEIKKTDPSIPVIATAVEPNEEYFGLGYGKYCDIFDFHIYETPASVRRTIREYKELQKKYDVVKPIWSTELGLNSQGQTRHVVAVEVFKKTAAFFAEGGENMSWFGLLYPDPEGKSSGSSGDSHNVFDCRFKRYAPRLDAVAWFNAVNAVGIKKFVEEKTYDGGVHAFLFHDREGRSMQILWKDQGRADVALPLRGAVETIGIDGSRRMFQAGKEGVSLAIGEDPVVVLYEGEGRLPRSLAEPAAQWGELPDAAHRLKPTSLTVRHGRGTAVELSAPPLWKVDAAATGDGTRFTLTPPEGSTFREAVVAARLSVGGKMEGELGLRLPAED